VTDAREKSALAQTIEEAVERLDRDGCLSVYSLIGYLLSEAGMDNRLIERLIDVDQRRARARGES
jgi:hypothetical protein